MDPTNHAPETAPAPESFTGLEDRRITGTLLPGSDADGDSLVFRRVGTAVGGTVTINAGTGAFMFTPLPNFFGAASFNYVVNDGLVDSAPKTVQVTVVNVNDRPQVSPVAESAVGVEEQPVTGTLLAGSDIDGDALVFKALGATGGSVVIDPATGAYTFTPFVNYSGASYFTYAVNDGALDSVGKTVQVVLQAINDAPSTSPQSDDAAGIEDVVLTGVLRPGVDPDNGDVLTYKLSGPVTGGAIALDAATGAYQFTPDANFNGVASFAYVVSDGVLESAPKTVRLTFAPANDAPTAAAAPESAAGLEDVPLAGTLLAGTDIDGDALGFQLAGAASGGTVAIDAATGGFLFTPTANHNGIASFSYVVHDGALASAPKTVQLALAPVNDAPVGTSDAGFAVVEDTALAIAAATLLANDTDPDAGDTLAIASAATRSAKGSSVYFDAAIGQVTYLADSSQFDALGAGQVTTDSFTYVLRDAAGLEGSATVTVQVTGAPAGPTIYGTVKAETLTGTAKNEQIEGHNGNDELHGLGGADKLYGQNGDDVLRGGDGADRLYGERGNDTLHGDRHNDDLFGGQGSDVFVFGADSLAGEVDRIGDFQRGSDALRLQGVSVTGFEVRDVGRVEGGAISGALDGVADTVIALSNGATVALIGVALGSLDGLLVA